MVLQLVPRIWQRRMVPSQYIWVNFKTAASSGSVLGGSEDNISTTDMVGPPDPVSNIRPLRLREPASEAVRPRSESHCAILWVCGFLLKEREVQELKQRMWSMKHVFWRQHNTHFKQVYIEWILSNPATSEAEERVRCPCNGCKSGIYGKKCPV